MCGNKIVLIININLRQIIKHCPRIYIYVVLVCTVYPKINFSSNYMLNLIQFRLSWVYLHFVCILCEMTSVLTCNNTCKITLLFIYYHIHKYIFVYCVDHLIHLEVRLNQRLFWRQHVDLVCSGPSSDDSGYIGLFFMHLLPT